MAEPKQASLCSFGLTKRLSLFRSAAYLPLVLKLFHVVKVVFVVLKIYSISVCAGRCCTIAPFMRERFNQFALLLRERFHSVYVQECGKAVRAAMMTFAACAACKAKSTQPRASEAAPWVRTSDVTTPCKGKSIHNQQDAQLYFCPFRAPAHAHLLTQGVASLALDFRLQT